MRSRCHGNGKGNRGNGKGYHHGNGNGKVTMGMEMGKAWEWISVYCQEELLGGELVCMYMSWDPCVADQTGEGLAQTS